MTSGERNACEALRLHSGSNNCSYDAESNDDVQELDMGAQIAKKWRTYVGKKNEFLNANFITGSVNKVERL